MAFLGVVGLVCRRRSSRGEDSRLEIHLVAAEKKILPSKSFGLIVSKIFSRVHVGLLHT